MDTNAMQQDISELRKDLACALRWAARLDLHEGVDNHFSISVADVDGVHRGNRFLINPYGWHWSEITASSLVLCDADGTVLEGEETVEDTALFIHSRVHIGAPGAVVALHTHMPFTTAITLRENGRLAMCEQNALMFDDRIAYDDDYDGLALDGGEGDRLARKLGNKSILMMASHGVLVTGTTMAQAFTDLYYLERAARVQVLAASNGSQLREISAATRARTKGQMAASLGELATRHFTALRRMLAREEPDFLN